MRFVIDYRKLWTSEEADEVGGFRAGEKGQTSLRDDEPSWPSNFDSILHSVKLDWHACARRSELDFFVVFRWDIEESSRITTEQAGPRFTRAELLCCTYHLVTYTDQQGRYVRKHNMSVDILWKGNPITCRKTYETNHCVLCMEERCAILKQWKKDKTSLINSRSEIYGGCNITNRSVSQVFYQLIMCYKVL